LSTRGHLFQVVQATDALGLGFGLGERGQKERSQDGNDGDHHQQLDQREGALAATPLRLEA
jgi:hypothetical protein